MLKDIFIKFKKRYIGEEGNYAKNIVLLVGGRVFAQALPVLVLPLISRMYSPSDFGLFGSYLTIVSILAVVSSGRYCLAIILPKKKEDAASLALLSFLSTLFVTILFAVVLVIWGDSLLSFFNIEIFATNLKILILSVFLIGLYEPLFYFALRGSRYKIISLSIIFQSLVLVVSRLLFGHFEMFNLGLVYSYLLGFVGVDLFLLVALRKEFEGKVSFEKIGYLAKKYIKFPTFSLIGDLLANLANMSPNLLLNTLFDSLIAGYFAMSDKFLGFPVWLITASVGDVFKQEATDELKKDGTCLKTFKKTSRLLLILGVLPFLLIFIFSGWFVPIFLGDGWEQTVMFIQILSFMYFARFVVSPVSSVVYVIEKQGWNILYQGMIFLSVVVGLVMGYYADNLMLGLIVWSCSSIVSYLAIYFISYSLLKKSLKK